MTSRRRTVWSVAALGVGVVLLVVTLVQTDLGSVGRLGWQFGLALPLALLPGAAWHVLRTAAWRRCFPVRDRPSFARVFQVRLAAEAFSYVTIRGVAGEPLKVVLLSPEVEAATSAAAVALERIAYLVVTGIIVTAAAVAAMATLPLSTTWIRVFAVVAASSAILLALVAVSLVRSRRSRRNEPPAPALRRSRFSHAIARFRRALRSQVRDLVDGDARRLGTLIALETAAYVMMALEVWAVLWAAGTSISITGAFAIETFTRAASIASAFIPGNIGALEASNVAAAAAVNAAAGAAALALVRRLRGLVWCAAGFVLYTREIRGQRRGHENHAAREPQSERPLARRALQKIDINDRTAVVIEDAGSDVTMWDRLGGLPIGERVVRAAARAGYGRVIVWAPRQQPGWLAIAGRGARDVHVAAVSTAAGWGREMSRLDPHIPVTLFSSSVVPSPALLDAASAVSPKDRVVEVRGADGRPGTGVYRTRPEHLASPAAAAASVADARHREGIPFVTGRADPAIRIPRRSDLPSAERQLRAGIIKATDGRVGRFNRRLSIPVSVALITWTRFNAHAMTVLLIVLGLYAGWLFSVGHYTAGVLAALISLAASILDGCDGELARLQYRESAFGCWLDTMGDYTYYLAIFTGLTAGAARRTGWTGFWWIGAALLCGTVLTFALLILLRERITAGRPEQLRSRTDAHFHARGKRWTRLAANLSTCATRATMPYGILAFAIADALSALVVLAAFAAQVYWISLAVELRRLLAGGYPPVRSTLDPGEPASSPGGI